MEISTSELLSKILALASAKKIRKSCSNFLELLRMTEISTKRELASAFAFVR